MNNMKEPSVEWECVQFADLTIEKLFAVLLERQRVFVLEQQCLYPDIDNKDKLAMHLIGWSTHRAEDHRVAAYLRILPPGGSYPEVAIGRVLVSENARGHGLGETLMRQGLEHVFVHYPDTDVRISAQSYLEKFYVGLGFRTTSGVYDEDGIPHIDMLLAADELRQFLPLNQE